MIDIPYFQNKLDSTIDKFSVLDEMFALQAELQQNGKLTYADAYGMYNFLRRNTNEHLSYVIDRELYEKNSAEQSVSNVIGVFNSALPFEQRCDYIGLLLEKSNRSFNGELKKILLENPDVVEHLKVVATQTSIPVENLVEYPLCICAEDCEVYGVEYKENDEYGYELFYEPKLNYIEYKLFQNGKILGLVDDKTFLNNFITN